MSDDFTFAVPVSPGSTIYSWDQPGNWSTGTIANGSLVTADLGGSYNPALTISVGGDYTVAAVDSLQSSALVSVDGGSLTILAADTAELGHLPIYYGGGFAVSGGTLDIASAFEIENGLTEDASSTIDIASSTGTLLVAGATDSSLAGLVTGSGELWFRGSNVTLDSSVAIAAPTLQFDDNATLQLAGDVTYVGTFSDYVGMGLNGNTLTLSGNVGTITAIGSTGDTGRVIIGAATGFEIGVTPMLNEPTYTAVNGNDVLEIVHRATEVGALYLGASGTDSAQLQIDGGAQYTITGADFIGDFDSLDDASVINAGTMVVTPGITASATIQTSLHNTGLITVTDGTLALASSAVAINSGTIQLDSATALTVDSMLSGSGVLAVVAGASADLQGAVAAGQSLMLGAGSTLRLSTPVQFEGKVSSFAATATLDLAYMQATIVAQTLDTTSGLEQVTLAIGTSDLVYALAAESQPYMAQQVGGSTDMTVACFAAGTRIATPVGPVAVEALRAGMRVVTTDGDAPIVWLGHRDIVCARHPRPQDVWPVRIAAHAFGMGRPARDLLLSPDHAIFVDGVLIPVRYLLNDATIRQTRAARVTYWHVELPRHAVLLADGLPAESYLDTGNRAAFANGGAIVQAHPDFARGVWARSGCAPLVTDGPVRDRVYRRLIAQALALGWRLTDADGEGGGQTWQPRGARA